MRVLVSGASGLIGTALCVSLEADGDDVVRLVRRTPAAPNEVYWDPVNGNLDEAAVEGFRAVVHLAGAGIGDRRWSKKRRRLILDSRVQSTELLAGRLASARDRPDVFVSGSAIGFYGSRAEPVTEADGPAGPDDFLAQVVRAWEGATATAESAGIRTAHTRTGIVLSGDGGALGKLLLPFRAGFGGKLGNGDTWWSWISIDDHVRAIKHIINTDLSGPVNLTGPNPVTNTDLTRALGRVLRRPTFFPVPRVALEALLGRDLAAALLFTSARILPSKLMESGFEFLHRDVESALRALLGRPEQRQIAG